jgi:NAD(P)-dependent dehydrogenase (short-subunit alcohol dehydrogenase family)
MSGRWRQEDIPSLTGKTAIVTGGDNGIGYYISLALAKAGAKVILTGLTHEHGATAEKEINAAAAAANAGGRAIFHHLDQGDIQAVDAWAKNIVDSEDRLDILINNAGLGQTEHALSKDGLETKYAVNNLSHYVITLRLLPLLEKTAAASPPYSVRIVLQSSEMHRFAPGDTKFASVDEINEPRDPAREYSRSKLGLIYFAKQLAKRKLAASTIVVTSVHPGTVDTDLQGTWGATYGVAGQAAEAVMRAVGKSAAEGAEPALWLATTTEITAVNVNQFQGKYFDDAHGKPDGETDQAKDELIGDNWWTLTSTQAKEILGESL